ncbi:hypothetical protein T06_9325 [Trichinella sp. T6]|nr:hypothetical protein T06_9325 [Trichinella sp. T6]
MFPEIGNREQPGYVCCAPPFISDRLMAGYKYIAMRTTFLGYHEINATTNSGDACVDVYDDEDNNVGDSCIPRRFPKIANFMRYTHAFIAKISEKSLVETWTIFDCYSFILISVLENLTLNSVVVEK